MTLYRRILLFCAALFTLAGIAHAQAPGAKPAQPNFGSTQNVLELKAALTPYHAPGNPSGTEADGSRWYMLQVSNDSVRPATRVLIAGQPPRSVLNVLPLKSRPAILALASTLGIETIAEGVETEEQRQALLELGCHLGQGYLLGRPAANLEKVGITDAA